MYFYDAAHEENFGKMLEMWPEGHKNPEYRVACYVVSHPEVFPKATKQKWEFVFDDWMEQQDFSHGIKLLVDLGLHLYGGGRHDFNLNDAIAVWDTGNYQVFTQACEIRKGWA